MSDTQANADAASRLWDQTLGIDASAGSVAQAVPLNPVGGMSGDRPALSPERPEPEEVKQSRPVGLLAQHVRNVFRMNARHRRENGIDDRLEASRLMSLRKYDPKTLADIAAVRATPLYFGWSETKRHALAAIHGEINNGGGEKPWTLAVTPRPDVPELVKEEALDLSMEKIRRLASIAEELVRSGVVPPEEVADVMPPESLVRRVAEQSLDEAATREKEAAEEACARMEALIWDQMVEGGFQEAFADAIEDMTTYGTSLLLGPIPRSRRKLVGEDGKDGRRRLKMKDDVGLEFEAVSPKDCYPSPGARKARDGDLVIRRRFAPADLAAFARAKEKEAGGWRRDAIDAILTAFPNGGAREELDTDWTTYVFEAEGPQLETRSCQIEGLEYFGSVRGSELLGAGIGKDASGKAVRRDEYYDVDCLTIMDIVVYCRILEPEIGRPVSKIEFFRTPESWWSEGIMDRCRDAQAMSNGYIRAMAMNAAQCSGPQVVVDSTRLKDAFVAKPWAVNYVKSPEIGIQVSGPPIQFMSVPSVQSDLMQGYTFCKTQGDELSEVPAFTYGQTQGLSNSVTRTASVLSIVTESSTRSIKHSIRQSDEAIRETVLRCYHWNMLHHKDERVKVGDVTCNPSGVMGYVYAENNFNKLLQYMQITGNPTDMQIIGSKGRAYLLREVAKAMQLKPDRLVPPVETLEMLDRLNKAKDEMALRQQQANAAATEQAVEAAAERGGASDGSDMDAGAPEEETATTPGTGFGTNARRAQQAAARRAVEGSTPNSAGLSPSQRGTIAATTGNPRARAAAAARGAAARRGA